MNGNGGGGATRPATLWGGVNENGGEIQNPILDLERVTLEEEWITPKRLSPLSRGDLGIIDQGGEKIAAPP